MLIYLIVFSDANGTKQLTCDICEKTFTDKTERNKHIEEHFNAIDCPNCGKTFIGDRAFEYHIATKCKVDSSRFQCLICNDKLFDSIEALNKHLEGKHKCFFNDNRWQCSQCQKWFAKFKYLRKHILELHDKATQFSCDVCGKEFNRKSNLIEHNLIHDGKYLADCEVCGKSYRTKSALRLHIRSHTGEKPYVCDICNEKSYAYNTDLKRHKRSAHGIVGTPHPCTMCEKVYYEPKLLKTHMKKFHKSSV